MSLESERERVVEQLSAHFAEDHLSTQELESRFERAYQATTGAELLRVLDGLPALSAPFRAPVPVRQPPRVVRQPGSDERRYMAILSTFRREGDWTPHRSTVLKAVMSNARIDLRDATFVDGEIDFDVTAVMAEVLILVPPGVRVDCDGFAFMGEFSGRHDATRALPDAPLVRVRGSAFMATVVVETRLPGESKWAARRRVRGESRKG